MNTVLTLDNTVESGDEAAELQAAIRQTFARMDELDVQIAQDQADIERLKIETRSMLTELNALAVNGCEGVMALWRDLLDYGKQILAVKEQTRKNTADIKEIQQEIKELTAAVQRLAYEIKLDRETEAREREMMSLRLENQLLRFERRLPTPKEE